MSYYLFQASYSTEGWAALVSNPENRMEAVSRVIEGLGGSVEGFWFAFGEADIVGICQMPDNVSVAAFSMAAAAGGAIASVKTTPLLTVEDGIAALTKAGAAGYQPPRG